MSIIVQKFGGTSVGTEKARSAVVSRVLKSRQEGYSPVVVVSALGRDGDPYSTDTLLALAREASVDLSSRELDLIMSCGEIISSVVICGNLTARGQSASVLTGRQAGVVTDDAYGDASILRVDPERIQDLLDEGKIPVVAGFQGATDCGEITTLGRGGSDTTAAFIGVALGVETVEIYTDVDGVKTADPTIVPEARTIDRITYVEMLQMANGGTRVLNPRAVDVAMRHDLPIRVRSTFSDGPGTLVTGTRASELRRRSRGLRPVTGVTYIPDLSQILVSNTNGITHTRTLRTLADSDVSVDMISMSRGPLTVVVAGEQVSRAEQCLRDIGLVSTTLNNCAKVSVVGSGMHSVPGVMANVSEALSSAGVEIIQTSDSHVTISCLVPSEDVKTAVRALHRRFGLDLELDRRAAE